MSRLALLIEYDGTNYTGWQMQPNGVAVEQRIEEALTVAYGMSINVLASGRTDAGVHACGQVGHFDVPANAPKIPVDKVAIALNTRLPRDIRVRSVAQIADDAHTRYDAIEREYVYRMSFADSVFERTTMWTPSLPVDPQAMIDATLQAASFLGKHDFTAFSKFNPSTRSNICDLRELSALYSAPYLTIRIRADRFVYGMCRLLVGALYSVARGRGTIARLVDGLERADRTVQLGNAPAHGLCLNRVRYSNGLFDGLTYF